HNPNSYITESVYLDVNDNCNQLSGNCCNNCDKETSPPCQLSDMFPCCNRFSGCRPSHAFQYHVHCEGNLGYGSSCLRHLVERRHYLLHMFNTSPLSNCIGSLQSYHRCCGVRQKTNTSACCLYDCCSMDHFLSSSLCQHCSGGTKGTTVKMNASSNMITLFLQFTLPLEPFISHWC
ncbi:unnamed protein product, partial [Staurois parvus]